MKKRKAKEKTLGEIYGESWQFIKDSRKQIYFAIGVFVFFILFGFFTIPPRELELKLIEQLKEIALMFEGLGLIQTIWTIFSNNLFVCLITIVFGAILGIFPFLILLTNGYLIGYVAQKAVSSSGILVLWRLFPHGIFELPAILISAGIGIKLGLSLFRKGEFITTFKKSMLVFALVVFVLLFIAAIIEGSLVFLMK